VLRDSVVGVRRLTDPMSRDRPGTGGHEEKGATMPRPNRKQIAVAAVAAAAVIGAAFAGGVFLGPGRSGASLLGDVRLTSSNSSTASGATITVTGTGTVNGTPDTLNLSIGVSATSHSASVALSRDNAEMARLDAVLIAHGVAAKDIQTSNLSLSPNYDSSGTAIVSYTASNDLSVTLRHLGTAGTIIDAAAAAGGNDIRIDGISFSISNESALLAQARALAMQDAKTEASQLATAGGTTLGSIKSIVDEEGQQVQPYPMYDAAGAAAKSVPLSPGTQQIQVQVRVVYALGS
jgi:uncharacterized protein YggE